MILNFSVQNFGSIKDEQTLTFEADRSTHLEDAYIIRSAGKRVLKVALIYGANASGKTTVLKALDFLRNIVLEPENKKTDTLKFNPFLFDPDTSKQNSMFSIEFIQNEVRYFYHVVFSQKAIVSEKLYLYNPHKALVYTRETDLSNQFARIKLGPKFSKNRIFEESLSTNTLWNNTVLGGYLKTNINFKELWEVVDWFGNYLNPIILTQTNLENYVTSIINMEKIDKSDVIHILKQADLHISNIIIREEERDIPAVFLEVLKESIKENDKVKELEEKGKLSKMSVMLEHMVNNEKYALPLELESEGTNRYYGFAGLLALLIKRRGVLLIDELEASLHPDLYRHFLISFLLNTTHSQIIATTHNREILDDKDLFRNDAIWFTDKRESCATELYSLADFDSSVIRNTTNILNAYKSGKLSGTPRLGDTFIDLTP